MSNFVIQKASKKKSKMRVILEGGSGSGKTLSSLLMAKAFGRAVVIDTENGSASLYSGHPLLNGYEFDVLELKEYSPDDYIEAINYCIAAKYDVLIIDSITHEWAGPGGCLELATKNGGYPKGWQKVSPMHDRFVYTLLHSDIHIICTCRSKQAYSLDEQTKKVTKQGLEPQQRDGLDYEMTTVFVLNQSHMAESPKDRTSLFDGKLFTINEETGRMLLNWLNSGDTATETVNESLFLQSIKGIKNKLGEDKFFEELKKLNVTEVMLSTINDRTKQIEIFTALNNTK